MSVKAGTINIAISFDENYVTPFYVLITSIFLNNEKNDLVIHTITSGVSDAQKKEITEYVERNNAKIFYYQVEPKNLEGLALPPNKWFTVASYFRLFFPMLVSDNVERLLYLDTDIVVIKDLAELYNLNIGSKPIGAVREEIGTARPEIFNTDPNNYFNSGVMLMNIPEWKKQQVTEKALQFIHDYPEACICVDQDALNATMIDNWHCIDRRYNVLYQFVPRKLAKKDFSTFLQEKVAIHFTLGEHKPWLAMNRNKFSYLYHQYQKKSPKDKEKKYVDFKRTPGFMFKYAKLRVIESMRNNPKTYAVLTTLHNIIATFIDL
jgi:lipopolysaccharide biosynthesis glycosyltransferase